MARLQIYFRRCFLLSMGVWLGSCSPAHDWYQKEMDETTKLAYSDQLWIGGHNFHYQGSVPDQFHLKESIQLNPESGDAWREKGIAYLKRGIADSFHIYYANGVKYRPEKWSGFRGYIYLYFYRDYQRAIADFNYNDEVIGEVAYSQGQSHDYMRGICYYGLKEYDSALEHLNRYINTIVAEEGEEWVDVYAYLYQGLALAKLNRLDEALTAFKAAEKLYPNLADIPYHRARIACMRKDYTGALAFLQTAKEYFNQGYYHQRPYVEVLEQLYMLDMEKLEKELQKRMISQV